MREKGLYVREQMQAEGLYVLEDYKGSSIPMKCRIMVGEYKGYLATVTWNNFIKGKRPDFRGLLEKEKFIKDKFEAEGYQVVNIPRDVKVVDKIDLISPEGNKWSVSYDTFRTGVRCPLDSYKSWGERCVASILKQNGINFKSQRTIFHEDGSRQYMDFYIEYGGQKYNIEYNGRQHYEQDPKNRLFRTLKEQQDADKKKKEYCEANGIVFIEIPYTINKVNDIAAEISKYLPIHPSKDYKVETFNNDKEIAEYYMKHSEKDTAKKFGIAGSTVRKTAYRLGYRKGHSYTKDQVREILDYYQYHTGQETADRFNITKNAVFNLARRSETKKTQAYDHEAVIAYYMTHSLKETTAKFGITRQGIQKIMKKYGVKKARR